MPAPSNTSDSSAIDISALPYSTTQDVYDAGTTYTVWYKYTAPADGTLRLFPFGYDDPSSCGTTSVYRPFTRTFTGTPGSLTQYVVPQSWNTTMFVPVYAGITYYFSIASVPFGNPPANPTPAILTLQADLFAASAKPIGSYFIPPDANNFPAAYVDQTTGAVLELVNGFPSGEGGAQLSTGVMLVEDKSLISTDHTRVIVYTQALLQVAVIDWDSSADGWYDTYIGCNKHDTFYVGYNSDYVNFSGNSSFRTISAAGTASGWTELPVAGLLGLCPSNDESVLYYVISDGSNKQVKRWDLVGGSPLSDFAANYAPGGNLYTPHDVLVLDDDTVLVSYTRIYLSGGVLYADAVVLRYDTSGTVINTYSFGNDATTGVRINYNYADPTTFIVYQHDVRTTGPSNCQGRSAGTVQIQIIDASSGSAVEFVTSVWTSTGVYAGPQSATVSDFGPSGCCPIFRTVTTTPVLPEPQIDNSVPCCECPCAEGGGTPTGVTGPVPSSVSSNWYRHCIGGGVVPTAPDVLDSEDWADEFPPKSPCTWLTIPGRAGSPTETDERWGLKPLSDPQRFVAGRLDEVSTIERRSSDKDGNYAPARLRIVAQDDDGTFRARLADPTRRDLINREARYELLSYAGRKAGLEPIPLIQGRIVDVQPALDRKAIVEIQDTVGAQYGPLDPQKTIGLLVGDEHPNKPESSKGRIYNILLGEKSDAGAIDSTGASASVGMMPGVDCGDTFIDGATPDPEGRLFNDALTAVDDKADVNLTGGSPAGTITYPTRVFVAPIIGGEIGPFSNVPTGFLDPDGSGFGGPSDPHAHRAVWMDIAGGADEYLAVFTKVPGFHPKDNPTVDTHARYRVVSGTPSMPAFPPRNGGVGPQWDFNADFLDDTDGLQWGIQTISAPLNLGYTITGTPGTTRYVYAVSALATLGESPRSAVLEVTDGPAVLNGTDNIVLTWDPPQDNAAAVIAYRIRGRQTNPPTMYLRITEIGVSPIPLTYTDDGTDAEKAFNAGTDGAVVSENVWAWIACAQHDGDVHEVYGSDGAEGDTPKRRLIGWDEGTILGPTSAGWPHAERYRVVGGIRQIGFYARGLPLKHHREGAVTFAWNGCGPTDADGLVIDQAFRMLLIFLNEFVEKTDGIGYRDGDFGPIETFANGDPKFLSSKFEAAQQQTIDWLTPGSPVGLGYVGTMVVTEPTALAEILRRFFNDYGGHGTTNHRGQWYPYLPNPEPLVGAGRLYAERREIARLIDHRFAKDEQENRVRYNYDYNFDTQVFRNLNLTAEDAASITAHGGDRIGVFQTDVKDCYFANDETTIEDRWGRHLTLYAYAPRYVQWASNLKSLPDLNGDPARFTHRKEGLGLTGEAGTPGVIMHTETSQQPYEVIQTAMLFRSTGSP